jgi:hypothetical protein
MHDVPGSLCFTDIDWSGSSPRELLRHKGWQAQDTVYYDQKQCTTEIYCNYSGKAYSFTSNNERVLKFVVCVWERERERERRPVKLKVKVKVKLSLCFSLTEHHRIEAYWMSGGVAPRIVSLGTRWRWLVSFTPRTLYPQGRASSTHWIGGWAGTRAGLEAVVRRKIPSRDSNHWSSSP